MKFSLAEALISRYLNEGVKVTKRKGTKSDAPGFSGNVPTLVWDFDVSPKGGGMVVYFEDFDGEGPGMDANVESPDGIYTFIMDELPGSEQAAEKIAQDFIKQVNQAISSTDPESYVEYLAKHIKRPWELA